jgi:hypothetical protein
MAVCSDNAPPQITRFEAKAPAVLGWFDPAGSRKIGTSGKGEASWEDGYVNGNFSGIFYVHARKWDPDDPR